MSQSKTSSSAQKPLSGMRSLFLALRHRKVAIMLVFGFSAGLPYALLLGTLYAWLAFAKVDLETMGVFSLIGLAYAFKFLWSPLVDRFQLPFIAKFGRRKSWLIPAQVLLGAIFCILSILNPSTSLGWFSLLAGIGAFASATQDVAIDAWRVDIADEISTVDLLSTVYQLGYRIAALVGGALALFLADAYSWPFVYMIMGFAMLFVAVVSCLAPDTFHEAKTSKLDSLRMAGELNPRVRTWSLGIVSAFWLWAIITVGGFMIASLGSDPDQRPDSVAFIRLQGPLIVIATVVVPSVLAAILEYLRRNGKFVNATDCEVPEHKLAAAIDHGYRALILPLANLMGRLGWAAILVLALILSYRITDNIWGSFAYPFYLNELNYSNSEVAVASKFFGVGMTMLGIAIGGICFALIGRMATLTLGAITAAASNLLYAELSLGGARIDLVGSYTGFTWLLSQFGQDERMARLMLAIAGENLAGGLAGAAFVAFLSSITDKRYSAVQYALLSSLTFLVGTLGRGALGEMIERNGYYPVFLFTAAIGLVAVIFCILEWIRTATQKPHNDDELL